MLLSVVIAAGCGASVPFAVRSMGTRSAASVDAPELERGRNKRLDCKMLARGAPMALRTRLHFCMQAASISLSKLMMLTETVCKALWMLTPACQTVGNSNVNRLPEC